MSEMNSRMTLGLLGHRVKGATAVYRTNMQVVLITLSILVALAPTGHSTQGVGGGTQDKIAVCHVPPGNPENPVTILISPSALPAHLAHGDVLGNCGEPVSTTGPTLDPVLSPTASTSTTITGVSLELGSSILVEGGAQSVEVPVEADQTFEVPVDLNPNANNHLFVTEIFDDGTSSPIVGVEVIQDGTPPTLFIDFPLDGAELTTETSDVAGRVSDLLSGFMGLTVTVNGIEAVVDIGIGTNGTFFAESVPLLQGQPTLVQSIGVDGVGNSASAAVTVTLVEVDEGAPFMTAISGNGQNGLVDTQLALPIIVQLLKGDGSPFGGKVVTFDVDRSNGQLSDGPVGGTLTHQALTDANGFAQAYWTLGSDAGCGNNRVAVTSTDIQGTVFFCASATAGPASQINVGSGDMQKAEVLGPATEPLRVWVSDSCNGVEGVPVTFIVEGGGGAVNGLPVFTVTTSSTGHAEVGFLTGAEPGNNTVVADFFGNSGNPVTFTIVGVESNPELPTSLVGVVVDNGGQPIQGASCTLEVGGLMLGPSASDLDGRFEFTDTVVSGPAELQIDGLVATHVGGIGGMDVLPGSFPALEFELVLVPNAENSLPSPVKLPPLDPLNARAYNGTADVTLTVVGIEGLSMTVKAGSVTLADGSVPSPANPTILSLNQVHADDVPMPMPDGAAPPFAWTLQPAGATFDPPVAITYPNMSGLPPGAIAYFLSFDHDTGEFEIIGSGEVTGDGLSIVSDPGVGIATAGWGCNCPPYSITDDCKNCNVQVMGPDFACTGSSQTYVAKATGGGTLTWKVSDGASSSSSSATVSDGECVSLDVSFNSEGPAGGPQSSGNKVEATLVCSSGLTDQGGVGVGVASSVDPGSVPITFTPGSPAPTPSGWGVTVFDDPLVDITAYCDHGAGVWRCRVTEAEATHHQAVRLLPGVVEVTQALVNSTTNCSTLNTMISSLLSVANQGADSGYYMLAAVQAHEDVHVQQYIAGVTPLYATFVLSAEALTVPLSSHTNAADATTALKGLAAYVTAFDAFCLGETAVANQTASHVPATPFVQAELGVVNPMITNINTQKATLGCP